MLLELGSRCPNSFKYKLQVSLVLLCVAVSGQPDGKLMFSEVWAKPHRFQNSGETNTEWAVVVWLGAGCQRSSLTFSLPIGQSSESPAVLGSRKPCSACTIDLCSPKGRGQSWREEELPPLVVVHIASENLHWTLMRAVKDLRELMPNGYENNLWFTEPKMALGTLRILGPHFDSCYTT